MADERGDPEGLSGAGDSRTGVSFPFFFEAAAIAAHVALALTLRAIAWPEVTTPAYLWSRGLLLYRDVKFVHTPGMMGLLAGAFRVLGVSATVLHGFALSGAVAAHGFLLISTRRLATIHRAAASLFFLAFFYGWQGNSVWPVPILAAFAIPVGLALEQQRFARAALLVGTMILFKQTSAYLLLPILVGIFLSGNLARAARVLLIAALPYFTVATAFAALGAGPDYFRWTIVVPFATGRAIFSLPSAADLVKIALAFAPLVAWTLGRSPGQDERRSGWLLATAGGLAMIAFPRFDFLELVAAVPCLALGAGRWMEDERLRGVVFARAAVLTLTLSFGTTIALGESFDGRILFWNSEPAFDRLVGEIRALPSAPLVSEIWENLLPRTGRLPPGRLYVHPWLWYLGRFDDVATRIDTAARKENAIVVSQEPTGTGARRVGPYWIRWAGGEGPAGTRRAAAPSMPSAR